MSDKFKAIVLNQSGDQFSREIKTLDKSFFKIGDVLVLTKPLGTGIIATAIKKGNAKESLINEAVKVMITLNKVAAETMVNFEVHSATDISGYGLLGHLSEICEGSDVSAKINYSNIPKIAGITSMVLSGYIPGGSKRNLETCQKFTKFSGRLSETEKIILADAQTSGGLLISLSVKNAEKFVTRLKNESDMEVSIIGEITEKGENRIVVI